MGIDGSPYRLSAHGGRDRRILCRDICARDGHGSSGNRCRAWRGHRSRAAARDLRTRRAGCEQRGGVRGDAGAVDRRCLALGADGQGGADRRQALRAGALRDRARSFDGDLRCAARCGVGFTRGDRYRALPRRGGRADRAVEDAPRTRSGREPAAGGRGGKCGHDRSFAARRCPTVTQRRADALVGGGGAVGSAAGERARPCDLRRGTAAPARTRADRSMASGVGS